jgi:peptide chain release factor 1
MADNSTILEKLDGLVARFEEISTLITDPAVIADQKRYVKLTKEYKDLDDLMKARKEYIQLLGNIEEAKNILSNESDADMREMAKEEMDNSQERLPALEEEIKLMLVPADPQDSKNAILEIRGGAGGESLPATFSVCMPSSVKPKAGKWKYPMQMKEQPEDSKKSFAVSQVTMSTEY